MPKKPTGKPSQRPCAPIDWKKVEVMMLAGSSGEEIAGSVGVHHDTFYRRFQQEYGISFTVASHSKKKAGHGNVRTRQYIAALNGNTQMLKILGEEWLGQGKGNSESSDNGDERGAVIEQQNAKEMASSLHNRAIILTDLETEQSLLHQECPRKEDKVRDELGTKDTLGGET